VTVRPVPIAVDGKDRREAAQISEICPSSEGGESNFTALPTGSWFSPNDGRWTEQQTSLVSLLLCEKRLEIGRGNATDPGFLQILVLRSLPRARHGAPLRFPVIRSGTATHLVLRTDDPLQVAGVLAVSMWERPKLPGCTIPHAIFSAASEVGTAYRGSWAKALDLSASRVLRLSEHGVKCFAVCAPNREADANMRRWSVVAAAGCTTGEPARQGPRKDWRAA
jgi:hypothetical protein